MKKIILCLSIAMSGLFASAQNGLENIIVEKYYISNGADSIGSVGILPAGSVTYRIYADMLPGYNFQALYGVPGHTLLVQTSTSFFNNEDYGSTTPAISATNIRKNSALLDSYFSVGGAATGKMGVLKTEDTDGSPGNNTIGGAILQNNDPSASGPINIGSTTSLLAQDGMITGSPVSVTYVGMTNTGNGDLGVLADISQVGNLFTTDNGSVAALGGAVGPTAANRLLIGQFTTDGIFHYELNVQIGTPTGGVQNFVAQNPVGTEISILSLIGTLPGCGTPATASAGNPQTICAGGSVNLTGSIGGSATSSTWSAPSGNFSNVNSLTSTYTPSISNGTVTLTLTTNDPDGAGPCTVGTSTVIITVNPVATANAGTPQTVCVGGAVNLTGSIGGSATSSTWSTPSGNFSNVNSLTSTYTPSITNGTVTLTLTTDDPSGPCPVATSTVVITVNPAATANAGTPQTVCAGGTINLTGSIGGSATSSTWSAPSGNFSNVNLLTSTYTPSITIGTVTLTLTTDDPSGPCPVATSTVVITVNPAATANAGTPQTVCAGGTVNLTGIIGGSATSSTWSAPSGNFSNVNLLTSTYTPSISNGTVTLTLTTNDPSGPCPVATATVVITVNNCLCVNPPTANAGNPQSLCGAGTVNLAGSIGGAATNSTWSAPSGNFSNANSLTSTYTPTISNGSVTLTLTTNDPDGTGPCSPASSTVTITVNAPATANAGNPQTVCAGGSVNLNGSIGGSATSSTWSAPSGNFSNVNFLTSMYTPSITNGTVTLTLTTDDPSGPCSVVTSTVVITVNSCSCVNPPTANAGSPQSICAGGSVNLAGSIGGAATSSTWSSPSGNFSNVNLLTSTYTPSVSNGTVTLTLTTNDPDGTGPCTAATSTVIITVNVLATANAGSPQTIAPGGTVNLSGNIGGSATTSTWSAPSGNFSNVNSLTSTYTPSISTGTVTLTLTTDDPAGACGPVSSTVVITVGTVSGCTDFLSYSRGEWGSSPNSHAGAYLANHFNSSYPTGLTIGDCGSYITFTSASAVRKFLPSGGNARALNPGTLVNPTNQSYGNNFAGQLVALNLNITLDSLNSAFAPSSTLFKNLVVTAGPFIGWTVEHVYNEANHVIGCGGSSSYINSLVSALSSINESWDDGEMQNNYLTCPPGLRYADAIGLDNNFTKLYPNPTTGSFSLDYQLEKNSPVTIDLYNSIGNKTRTLLNNYQEQGTHSLRFNMSDLNLKTGLYMIRLTTGEKATTLKVLFVE